MRTKVIACLLLITAQPLLAGKDDTTYRTGSTTYHLPFAVPTRTEVLQRADLDPREAADLPVDVRFVGITQTEPRFYPLVGPARAETAVFFCRVDTGQRVENVLIERTKLIRAKLPTND